MTQKDVLKLLLCNYGYDRNIKIETYYGDEGYLGYDISAESKDDVYTEANCEGFMFHVHMILDYMTKNNISYVSDYWRFSVKNILDDEFRNNQIYLKEEQEKHLQEHIQKMKPLEEFKKKNNPCPTCAINKKDQPGARYNCKLGYTNSCNIVGGFWADVMGLQDKLLNNEKI